MLPRILILDDESSICVSLSLALQPNYDVAWETDPRLGLARLQGESFDLVLLDMVIGEYDGLDLLEQIRSLATLMVLGFYDKEIKRLQLSENIIFAAGGICAGIPRGIGLSYVIIALLSDMPLQVNTRPVSFVLSCAVTLLFALLVNWMIGRKMREIDMLGALKSVE